MLSETEIITAISEGDNHAFALLYDQYSTKVYNTALSYSKNKEEAEEITQDVFLKIHKNASNFKFNSTLNTWIYRITVNTSLNYKTKRNRFNLFKNTIPSNQSVDFKHPGVLLENKENAVFFIKP